MIRACGVMAWSVLRDQLWGHGSVLGCYGPYNGRNVLPRWSTCSKESVYCRRLTVQGSKNTQLMHVSKLQQGSNLVSDIFNMVSTQRSINKIICKRRSLKFLLGLMNSRFKRTQRNISISFIYCARPPKIHEHLIRVRTNRRDTKTARS